MATPRKQFGKRGIKPPPVITHAPEGLAGGPTPLAPTQMRTLAITLGLLGAAAIGVFAAAQAHNRRENCAPPEGSNPDGPPCQSSGSSSGHGGSSGWSGWSAYSGSSGNSESSGHSGSSSSGRASAVSFGGFGHAGAGHGGGGGE
jgi:hypothetical protein